MLSKCWVWWHLSVTWALGERGCSIWKSHPQLHREFKASSLGYTKSYLKNQDKWLRVEYHRLDSGWERGHSSLKGMLANDLTSFHQAPSPRPTSSQQYHFLRTGPFTFVRDISSKLVLRLREIKMAYQESRTETSILGSLTTPGCFISTTTCTGQIGQRILPDQETA